MIRWFVFLMLEVCTLCASTVYFVNLEGIDSSQYFYDSVSHRDEVAKPFCCLREAIEHEGFTVKFTDDAANIQGEIAALISFGNISSGLIQNLAKIPREKCILFNLEPPVILPESYELERTRAFGKVFVMFDDLVDNVHYFKFYAPQPRLQMVDDIPDFSRKKFLTMICGNKDSSHPQSLYAERRKAISYFSRACPQSFDLYGGYWPEQRVWKGTIPAKWDTLKQYKFCLCYENMGNQKGYITEKLFDCFVGGCVPIYLGASNVTDVIPKACFIDRRMFASDGHLYEMLRSMDKETYDHYLEAIRIFLSSPQAKLFSIEHFVELTLNALKDFR